MGRKYNITSMFLAQSYFRGCPQVLRQNSTYIVLKKVASNKDFNRICAEYGLCDPKALLKMYRRCVRRMEDFLTISMNDREGRQFRCGFAPIKMGSKEEDR
jgi:hypothetical protein